MNVDTRRPIPFGEQMREKHCRLLGHIGQIGVMRELGRMHVNGKKLPGSSAEMETIRQLCASLHREDFSEVVRRINTQTARENRYLAVANRLGMTHRSTSLHREVLSGTAIAALRFSAGETRLAIPTQYQDPFHDLITFYANRTAEEITLTAEVAGSEAALATEPIRRSGSDIAFEVKYLEPVLADGPSS